MPFNGSGSFSLAEPPFVPNTTISSAAVNSDLSDIADGLSDCLTTDGQSTMSAQIKGFAGTVTVPGYGFSTDPNTGIYRIGPDNLGVTAGGTKRLDVSSTGLGVTGDVSASGNLSITGTGAFTGLITGTTETLSGLLTLSGTSHMLLNSGTTAQRPTPASGAFRYNTETLLPEFSDANAFNSISAAQPISGGFRNLVITNNSVTPNSQIDIDADAVTVETSAGRAYRLTGINVTINASNNGANGLDAGSLASATWYAVFVIYNPATSTIAGLLSTSASSPTLPSGYNAFARFGWFRTAPGSAQFFGVMQKGRSAQYIQGLAQTSSIPVLASGVAGTVTSTYAAVATGLYIPSTASDISVMLQTVGNVSHIILAPNNSWGVNGQTPGPAVSLSSSQSEPLAVTASMLLESSNIYWASDSSQGRLYAVGWQDNI